MPRRELEAPPLPPAVDWDTVEQTEGTLMASRAYSKEDNGNLVHEFSAAPEDAGYANENGDFIIWGTVDLDRKLKQAEAGDRIIVTFLGTEPAKNNPRRKVKMFKVEVDD